MRPAPLLAAILLASASALTPTLAHAQSSPTQSRTGLGTGSHPTQPANSLPAGSENATTGPQSRPAYPSGSATPNPGAGFVGIQPVPAAGQATHPPGNLTTTTIRHGGAITHHPGGRPTQERAGTAPRR